MELFLCQKQCNQDDCHREISSQKQLENLRLIGAFLERFDYISRCSQIGPNYKQTISRGGK